MRRLIPAITFECPRCGSHEFGSCLVEGKPVDGKMQRYCHGRVDRQGCGFTWPDRDDWQYFRVDGVKLDVMEYDAVMARIRATPVEGIPPDPPKVG